MIWFPLVPSTLEQPDTQTTVTLLHMRRGLNTQNRDVVLVPGSQDHLSPDTRSASQVYGLLTHARMMITIIPEVEIISCS